MSTVPPDEPSSSATNEKTEQQPTSAPTPNAYTNPSLRRTTVLKGSGRNYVIGGVSGFPRPKPDETPAPQDREGDDGESAH